MHLEDEHHTTCCELVKKQHEKFLMILKASCSENCLLAVYKEPDDGKYPSSICHMLKKCLTPPALLGITSKTYKKLVKLQMASRSHTSNRYLQSNVKALDATLGRDMALKLRAEFVKVVSAS